MSAVRRVGGRVFLEFLVLVVVIFAVLLAAGWAPTRRLAGEQGLGEMVAACGTTFAASILSTLPVALAARTGSSAGMVSVVGALAVRLVAVAVVATGLMLKGLVQTPAFLIWVGISYLAYLPADVRYAVALERLRENPR